MASSSSASEAADAFDHLNPTIQRWIRAQNWSELRPIQVQSIRTILEGDKDVLISASTAAGKTEAAFLPALTLVAKRWQDGISVLYVSPLKALINDQMSRLDVLCDQMEIAVTPWHGDAPQSGKSRLLKNPKGIALITPESIEAMFVRHPKNAQRLLSALDFIIIDEVHAFMQGPRGLHLGALLKRIDALSAKAARRIGLSATIGDLDQAAAWLRPTDPSRVSILKDPGEGLDLQLQIRGYLNTDPAKAATDAKKNASGEISEDQSQPAITAICDHLYATLRGSNNLVFGGSRKMVETVADTLRSKSEQAGTPNEFFPHHGNLSKELREDLEKRLKTSDLPTTAICTTTLELGIDIGSVKSIAQIGAPRSISSLRQRLGRTGRRKGVPSILRIYATEADLSQQKGVLEELRPNVVRAVASIRLLTQHFVEPATSSDALATALLHQTLSIIAERGGARAEVIFGLIGGPGPFASVSTTDYIELLKHVATPDVDMIDQAPDGTLMFGARGEQIVQSRDFYALFQGDQEWRLAIGAKTLGTIPLSNVVAKGNLVVFAGRRWEILDIDEKAHVLEVAPHMGGHVPHFEPTGAEETHSRLIAEMRKVYESDDVPEYLDPTAKTLLAEGRSGFRRLNLGEVSLLDVGRQIFVFPWIGSAAAAVLAVSFAKTGVAAERHDLGISILDASVDQVKDALQRIANFTPDDLKQIEDFARGLCTAKFDDYIPDALLRRLWGRRNSQVISSIPEVARTLLAPARVEASC